MYTIGEYVERPWGSYKVIDVGQNYCKKEIIVNPHQLLSLQSHNYRKEQWTVKEGMLIAMLNNNQYVLQTNDIIEIPVGALHCMANTTNIPCVVEETQTGICKEDDIIRYADNYGRTNVEECIGTYNNIKNNI